MIATLAVERVNAMLNALTCKFEVIDPSNPVLVLIEETA